jgi:hypothetical protein
MMVDISIHREGGERTPMQFIISETDEILISHSGLALAGALLQGTAIQRQANDIRLGQRKRPALAHGNVLASMIGLLCLGKPDFEAIEEFRGDEFFRCSLGLQDVPSEGTLRQRLDELGHRPDAILREESAAMVARHTPKITPCHGEWVAMDIDCQMAVAAADPTALAAILTLASSNREDGRQRSIYLGATACSSARARAATLLVDQVRRAISALRHPLDRLGKVVHRCQPP